MPHLDARAGAKATTDTARTAVKADLKLACIASGLGCGAVDWSGTGSARSRLKAYSIKGNALWKT